MIYVIGTIGFIAGFFLGQMLLLRMLKNVPREELLHNKSTHWKYGLLNWVIAITTAACAVHLYKIYFLDI